MLQEIIDNLHEAETCKQLIDRLYGRSKPLKNQPKSSTLKPGFKKNVRKNVADTIEKSSDLNSKDDPKKDTVMGERIVTACNVLLECDIYDVYNMTNDDIQSLLHRLSKLVEKINRGRELVDEEVTNIDDEEFDDEDETRKKRKKDGMIEFDDEDEDEDGEEERGDLGKRKIDSKIMERISKNNGFKMPPPMSKLKKPSGEIPTSRDKIGNGDSATLSKKIEKPEEVKVSPLDSAIDAMKVLNNQLDANPFSKTPTNLKENQTIEEDEQSDNDDIF